MQKQILHRMETGDYSENIAGPIPVISEVIEKIDENPGAVSEGLNESTDSLMTTESAKLLESNTPALQFDLEMTNSVPEVETMASISYMHTENGSLPVQSEVSFSNCEKNETFSSKREVDAICILFSSFRSATAMLIESYVLLEFYI